MSRDTLIEIMIGHIIGTIIGVVIVIIGYIIWSHWIDRGGPGFNGDIEAYGDNIVYGVSAHISNDDVPYLAIALKDPEEK